MNKINEINSQKQESHRSNMMLPFAIAIMAVLNSSPSDAQMTLDPGPVKPWPKAMLDAYCRGPGGIPECGQRDHGDRKHLESDPDIARQKAIDACNNNPNLEVYNVFDANSGNILQNIICDDSSRQAIENSLSRRNFNGTNFPGAFGASKSYVTTPLGNTNGMFFNCSDVRAGITSGTELRDIPNAGIAILFEQNKYRDGHNGPRPCEGMVSPTTLFVDRNLSISDATSVVMPRNGPGSLVPPSGFLPVGKHNPAPQVVPTPPSVPMHSHPSMFMPPIIAPFGGAPAGMPHTPFVAPRGGKGGGGGAGRGFFPQAVVPFTSGEGYQPNPNHYIPGVYRPGIDAPAVYQPIR